MDTAVFGRADHVVELVAESIGEDAGDVADKLLAEPGGRRYLILDSLAQTRSSTVFAAVDQILARAVALKIHHTTEVVARRQLMFGNRAMARLDHPNVVRIYDLGEHEGQLFTTMELCDANLRVWAPGKSWPYVLERLVEAGRGLQAVHAEGLVHGDVKPGNILIKDGAAKLADLDLAAIDGGLGLWVRGSAGYIAPEVGSGLIGVAADVFGFACTVWASVYGAPPFGASTGEDGELERLMDRAREGAVLPVEDGRMPDLTRLLLPALQPRPEDRMDFDELVALLVTVVQGEPQSSDAKSVKDG
ncbi:Serine/threonine-protein kinase PknA [Enhygromyxa salina]|uniref:Serine/threonine-protein kinase PknA n=2 Tax=Enhygromyxa salina TaxID=215803 RepID=A0A2S9YHN0_9BACT|nr:Serine/threonine-protein kinase PknA [Enhygromyxa salina]